MIALVSAGTTAVPTATEAKASEQKGSRLLAQLRTAVSAADSELAPGSPSPFAISANSNKTA